MRVCCAKMSSSFIFCSLSVHSLMMMRTRVKCHTLHDRLQVRQILLRSNYYLYGEVVNVIISKLLRLDFLLSPEFNVSGYLSVCID